MRYFFLFLGITCFLLLSCFSVPTVAQITPGRVMVGVHGSTYKYWGDFTDDQYGWGLQGAVRYDLAQWLGVDVTAGSGTTPFRITQDDLFQYSDYFGGRTYGQNYPGTRTRIDEKNEIRFSHYELSGVIHLVPSSRFIPQVFLGVGLTNHYPTNWSEHSPLPNHAQLPSQKWNITIPVGIGFEYFLNDRVSFTSRLIARISTTDSYDDVIAGANNDYFATLGGGLNFYIGIMDTDGDGLSNETEERLGTDPNSTDTDGDGVSDFDEVTNHFTNPTKFDTDGDGLSDGEEVAFGTSPLKPDGDYDGLNDAEEFSRKTNPLNADTDGDGLRDGDEVHRYGTDPLSFDTDGDGLSDSHEIFKNCTDPLKADTNNNGIIDSRDPNPCAQPCVQPCVQPCNQTTTLTTPSNSVLPQPPARSTTQPCNCDTLRETKVVRDTIIKIERDTIRQPVPPQPPVAPAKVPKPKREFNVRFLYNSDQIDYDDAETNRSLRELKDYLQSECDDLRVTFEGHTSSEGKAEKNVTLSQERAVAIRNLMISQGIPQQKIQATVGYGSTLPRVSEPSPAQAKKMSKDEVESIRKRNRRITVREDVPCND